MLNYLPLGVLGLSLFWIFRTISSLNRNIALAKASGLPYFVSPLGGWASNLYCALEPLFMPILKSLPYIKDSRWPVMFTVHRGWTWHQRMREQLGEAYLIVSPWMIYLNCNNAEGIMQILTRRHDFIKPLEIYGIVDIFGSSIISTEGDTWKRHRKIVAPSFAEKSNLLVWQESLRQASGMLNAWSRMKGNTKESMVVVDVGTDTQHLALHVISGAGFGVSQLWHGENEDQLGENIIPGFNTEKLDKGHTITFKDALQELISGVIWKMIVPDWLLRRSPFDFHKRLLRSHFECTNYFKELAEYKTELMEKGNMVDARTMDIMAPMVNASQKTPEESNGLYLTKQEVTANSWLLLFAGHETTANTLHYTLTFLAMALDTQSQLQKEIDSIVGSRPKQEWTYEKDMGRLYNGLAGASFMETLRLMPPVLEIPKVCRPRPQYLRIDGKEYLIPAETVIHADGGAVQRNPKYWPHKSSMRTDKEHDMDDFVPQRWLSSAPRQPETPASAIVDTENLDGVEKVSFETTSGGIYVPIRGSFIPFAEGARSCPGRRFAQVELTAVLASIFQEYTVELDVSKWASDAKVAKMSKLERKELYEKATVETRKAVDGSIMIIALKMITTCPLRIVRRGEERFMDCYI